MVRPYKFKSIQTGEQSKLAKTALGVLAANSKKH
jgi:hypothetical protein